ncbi:MAG: sulfite exporter TauE/SafE family protein [Candidatus Methanomethylophilaceae archaeon]|jgi:hypothetical protein|nr:sulfite exporter TauE/SafE family protein [Candidatus Methanomethylophilaceae archaeon]NCA73921.1 sulfite exporter TauE/SafE family protein [Gammaproteobacteria bacterium]MDD2936224.1 sulfite exporter TauE/SafE family protein [Candidatus Methanomethylophilaceae archaeon]MDD3351415.1 sulfite exporter TauE/SafE family protein [Candidatus Methanomethylophilaceae archaeon]MDD3986953.1 sulfite exporter TauE/SafE family protein [Candidatus Methanomethylophilaceae archaeon]
MGPELLFSLILVGVLAGVTGALFGIGGGMLIVPILVIFYGLAAKDAAAISLVGIVATSVGASAVYVDKGISNIRLGLFLEITTVIGAIAGVVAATYISNAALTVIFSLVLVYSGAKMIFNPELAVEPGDCSGKRCFTYYDDVQKKDVGYQIRNTKSGAAMCTVAGVLASMTGIGGGAIKVPIMNLHMHVPIKAAAATSNYMIGITAFAGAVLYFAMGDISLTFAGAVAVGGFIGSMIGTKITSHVDGKSLKRYFSVLLFFIATVMMMDAGGLF